MRLNELSFALSLESEASGSAEGADRAVSLMEEALRVADGSPMRFGLAHNLAATLLQRNRRTHDPSDLNRVMELMSANASETIELNPVVAVRTATDWARLEEKQERWGEAARAYGIALAAGRRLVETQMRWMDANASVRQMRWLPQLAAYAYAKSGNAAAAIDALERGRVFLLHSMLDRRLAELRELATTGHAGLADEYTVAADRLRFLDTAVADHPTAAPPREDLVRGIRAARLTLADIVERVRALPGHERFGDRADQALAAPPVALVYLIAADTGGVALIRRPGLEAGDSKILQCPELDLTAIYERAQDFFVRPASTSSNSGEWVGIVDDLTSWLWDVAMGAIVAALESEEEVVLIPVGLLALLPWHAAWRRDPERGRVYALDELRIGYAPAARVIANNARPPRSEESASLLIVETPEPVQASPLPLAELEAESVSAWFDDVARLRCGEATREAVLDHLDHYGVAHLICHGFVALEHPLDSFLLMSEDAPLTLRDILAQPHDRLRLVVLSACDSGAYSFDNMDEVFSLASGFLAGGVPEAVASLWPVPDTSTALLMTELYRRWMGDGQPLAEALRRAQQWVRDSTNNEKLQAYPGHFDEKIRRMTPVALRTWGRARSFASPVHWAAFTHNGWAAERQ